MPGEQGVTAFILMIIELGMEYDVARRIKEEIPAVKEVHVTYGEYDIVAKIVVGNLKELDEVVTKIRGMPGVKSTTTLISSGS